MQNVFVWTLRDVLWLSFIGFCAALFVVAKVLDWRDNRRRRLQREGKTG
jgi:hypothetical protein